MNWFFYFSKLIQKFQSLAIETIGLRRTAKQWLFYIADHRISIAVSHFPFVESPVAPAIDSDFLIDTSSVYIAVRVDKKTSEIYISLVPDIWLSYSAAA